MTSHVPFHRKLMEKILHQIKEQTKREGGKGIQETGALTQRGSTEFQDGRNY